MSRRIWSRTGADDRRLAIFALRLGVMVGFPLLSFMIDPRPASVIASHRSSASESVQQSPLTLKAGAKIERNLAGGESHDYKISAGAEHYLRVIIDQKGIDLAVTLLGPDGRKLLEVNSPTGAFGPELVSALSDGPAEYRLEVRSLGKDVVAGKYELRVSDLHPPSPQDRMRFEAEQRYKEGLRLEITGGPESIRNAILKYQQAMQLFRDAGDRGGEAAAMFRQGMVDSAIDDNEKALECYNRALTLSQAAADRRLEAESLNAIGLVYEGFGEGRKALEYYNRSLPIYQAIGDLSGEAAALRNIGLSYDSLGEKQKALDNYNQALPFSRSTGDRKLESTTLNNIGSVYYSLGEIQKALEYHEQAATVGRQSGDRNDEVVAIYNIGTVYRSLNQSQKALEYFNRSLGLSRDIGDRRIESASLTNIGGLYASLGETQKALEFFNQALPTIQQIGNRRLEVSIYSEIGRMNAALGDHQKAAESISQALKLSRATGDAFGEAHSYLGLAKIEAAQGKFEEARATIDGAIKIAESLRTKVASPALRAAFFARAQLFYAFDISILMNLHALHPDQGHDRLALQTAERARARTLLEGLTETQSKIRRGVDQALLDRESELRRQLGVATERRLRLLNGQSAQEEIAAAGRELDKLSSQYQELEAEIRTKSPRYAALTQPAPLSIDEIQKQTLDEKSLLLEYFLGAEKSFLWVVSAGAVKSYTLPKRSEIEQASIRVKSLALARGLRDPAESSERRQARIAAADLEYGVEAERLSRMILGPALAELGDKRLAIIADGELQDLAFGALPIPSPATGSKNMAGESWTPLIVENEIINLPSASAFALFRRETAGRPFAPKALAVLADPVFDKTDERIKTPVAVAINRKGKPEPIPAIDNDLTRSLKDVMGEEGEIARLPFSRIEAEAILSLAPKKATLRALDFRASRATALSEELGQYQIIHFAAHGLLNKAHPELSGVVLSLVDPQGNPQDGFLQLHDIYNLNLPVELVTLSACQTGLGKAVSGEGLIGLTRGFMYAGSRRVVASLWAVQDLASAELMKRFYGAMLGDRRLSPSAALRAAQTAMWKQPRWRAPYYWGGFAAYGEW